MQKISLQRLLEGTSRTFALNIPLLPEPTRREVTVAYLLFRVADTLEDSTRWPRDRKLAALEAFAALVTAPRPAAAAGLANDWSADPPLDHGGYLELLAELPAVLDAALALEAPSRSLVLAHTARTARRMAAFVAREREGRLELVDLADLRDYCYAVAGIVGEMLTELFLAGRPALAHAATALRGDSAAFGEALQLVNILKDAAFDAREGRRFLPSGVDRAEVVALARSDLAVARAYCERLEAARAERGLVAFCALPVALAGATLARVESAGPGAKIARHDVATIFARLSDALDAGAVARTWTGVRD